LTFTAITAATVLAALTLSAQPAAATTVDETATPFVQRDLAIAVSYWRTTAPATAPACGAESVLLAPMVSATGNDGASVSANRAWAETGLGSCTITLSPSLWRYAQYRAKNVRYTVCVVLAHEYGHTIGLSDTSAPGAMNESVTTNPLCGLRILGWARLGFAARRWLLANHYASPSVGGPAGCSTADRRLTARGSRRRAPGHRSAQAHRARGEADRGAEEEQRQEPRGHEQRHGDRRHGRPDGGAVVPPVAVHPGIIAPGASSCAGA
jgi:hypothetical protein